MGRRLARGSLRRRREIDPRFNTVEGHATSIGNIDEAGGSVATRSQRVWVAPSSGFLTRLDPERRGSCSRSTRTVPPADRARAGCAWFTDFSANTVTRLDLATDLLTPIAVPRPERNRRRGQGGLGRRHARRQGRSHRSRTRSPTNTVPVGASRSASQSAVARSGSPTAATGRSCASTRPRRRVATRSRRRQPSGRRDLGRARVGDRPERRRRPLGDGRRGRDVARDRSERRGLDGHRAGLSPRIVGAALRHLREAPQLPRPGRAAGSQARARGRAVAAGALRATGRRTPSRSARGSASRRRRTSRSRPRRSSTIERSLNPRMHEPAVTNGSRRTSSARPTWPARRRTSPASSPAATGSRSGVVRPRTSSARHRAAVLLRGAAGHSDRSERPPCRPFGRPVLRRVLRPRAGNRAEAEPELPRQPAPSARAGSSSLSASPRTRPSARSRGALQTS